MEQLVQDEEELKNAENKLSEYVSKWAIRTVGISLDGQSTTNDEERSEISDGAQAN